MKDTKGREVKLGDELKKQAVDQPLHFLWAIATALPLALLVALRGVRSRWTLGALGLFVASSAAIVVREVIQWPSTRPWDPWLDWSFFALGYAAALGAFFVARRRR